MHRRDRNLANGMKRQIGTTLVVVLVLILLATLLTVFAVDVGVFSQRMSANDVRARLVRQTAQSGLSQGIEYFNLNSPTVLDTSNTALWQRCTAADTSYPCGAVPVCAPYASFKNSAGATVTSDGKSTCSQELQRRGNMYRFIGGGTYDVNGNGSTSDAMDQRSLPLDRRLTSVGNGFGANYGVGAVICMVKTPAQSTDPTECTTNPALSSGTVVITLVSTATIKGESAKTTITTTIGRSSSLYAPTNKPPLVASGTVGTSGTFNLVPNPNAGGTGVPVSVWTREPVKNTGTPQTCYFDTFLRNPSGNKAPISEGSNPPIVTCDYCDCPANADSLSFTVPGNSGTQGIDIVDVDPTTPQCTSSVTSGCKPNKDIQPGEFPCDLFQYTFGDKAWIDTDGDHFCESRLGASVTANTPTGSRTYKIGEDENYLLAKATYICPNTNAPYYNDLKYLTSATIVASCSTILNSSATGMIWDQQGTSLKTQVGTPDAPVALIEDGTEQITAGARLFGLLFVRPALYGAAHGPSDTPNYDANILDPVTGAVKAGLTGGGTGNLQENGHANIYGSVVVQGTVLNPSGSGNGINGTGAIVYSQTILEKLGLEKQLNKISPVPASWSDRYAY